MWLLSLCCENSWDERGPSKVWTELKVSSLQSCRTTLKPGIYSLRRKQLRLARWHKGWLGWRDASNKLCSPAQKDALWYSFSFCFHRLPLCRRVIGFTHDDKVERSDPAFVRVSSFLIFACERRSQGEVFICYYTVCHTRGIKPATGYWCQLVEQREERLLPGCHYFRFLSLKCGLGAPLFFCLFMSLSVWKIYGLCAIGCAKLSQQECNEKRGTLQMHPDVLHY